MALMLLCCWWPSPSTLLPVARGSMAADGYEVCGPSIIGPLILSFSCLIAATDLSRISSNHQACVVLAIMAVKHQRTATIQSCCQSQAFVTRWQ